MEDKGIVLLNSTLPLPDCPEPATFKTDGNVGFKAYPSEGEMLAAFWGICRRQNGGFLTYNGRAFDVPFLVVRSAVYGLPMVRKLVRANRYSDDHVDLKDCLDNYGSLRAPVNFDVLCRTLGVPSPKTEMSGAQVGQAWRATEHAVEALRAANKAANVAHAVARHVHVAPFTPVEDE